MAFSTNGPTGQAVSPQINVTPLIDVLLVLLIIFMVIVPVASRGLDAAVPTASTPALASQPVTPVLLQVDGEIYAPVYRIDGVSLSRDEIPARLQALLAPRAERLLTIQGDPRLDYRTIADLVDAGRSAGADTVGLITPTSRH